MNLHEIFKVEELDGWTVKGYEVVTGEFARCVFECVRGEEVKSFFTSDDPLAFAIIGRHTTFKELRDQNGALVFRRAILA